MTLTSCGQRQFPVGLLQIEEEIFNPLVRENLRGLSTWRLVAEAQHFQQQVEDWEAIQSVGGMVEEELRQAMRYTGLIAAEVKRRSQFDVAAKAQAASIEIRALKELCVGHDFLDVMGHYLEVSVFGREYKFKCPVHGDDHPSGVLHPLEGKWHCFGCNRGGDVFDGLMFFGRLTFREAAALIGKLYGFRVGRGG